MEISMQQNAVGLATLTRQAAAVPDVKASTVKTKSMTGVWLLDTNMIVEGMNQSECLAQLPLLADKSDRAWYTIGGILNLMRENQWWSIKGYQAFNVFVEEEVGIPMARATRWMNTYTGMNNLGITMEDLDGIGWTKMKDALPYMRKENKEELLGLARTMSASSFAIYLKGLGGKNKKTTPGSGGGDNNIVRFKCSFFEDQWPVVNEALERARAMQQTEADPVALTSICEQYLSGNAGGGHVTRGAIILALQEAGDQGLSDLLSSAFPHLDISISEASAFDPTLLGADDHM